MGIRASIIHRRSCVSVVFTLFTLLCVTEHSFAQGGSSATAPSGGSDFEFTIGAPEAPGNDIALGNGNEPMIAINPLDPNNIVVALPWSVRISQDGGATWSAPIQAPVPPTHFCDGDPSLTFDGQGRLLWSYLGGRFDNNNVDIFITQLNPATGEVAPGFPVNVTESIGMPAQNAFYHDKEWLDADRSVTGPFADRLYLAWTELNTVNRPVLTSFSSDHGLHWSAATPVSSPVEGFTWPAHVAVAPNGDVYVAYHSQVQFNQIGELGGNPTGVSGKEYVVRSTDGGASYPQKNLAYAPGRADLTFNVQSSPGTIPLTDFWLQGSVQPWVLPDPKIPGAVYVIANDDPNNAHGFGDDADVFIVRSFDNGLTWSAPQRVNSGRSGLFEVMPTAAIDPITGDILVSWYSNVLQAFNNSGNFLLDLFYAVSQDQGASFSTGVQVNDSPFDPDFNAPVRLGGPPPTLRIGEYNSVALVNGEAHFVWTGNSFHGQQILTDASGVGAPPAPCQDITNDAAVNAIDLSVVMLHWGQSGVSDLNKDGTTDGADLAYLLGNWGPCI